MLQVLQIKPIVFFMTGFGSRQSTPAVHVCFSVWAIINSGSVELFKKKKAGSHKLASEFSSHKGSRLFPFCFISHGSPPTSSLWETALKKCESCYSAHSVPITLCAGRFLKACLGVFLSSFYFWMSAKNRTLKSCWTELNAFWLFCGNKKKDFRVGGFCKESGAFFF